MRIQLTQAGKKAVACAVAGAAVLALLLFFVLFRVTRVEVVGSTRYTEEQIREYALNNPVTSNTLLAIVFKSHIEAENIPFVESFDLERLDMHTLRVHVNEKKIVGYVLQGTDKLYFDKDGFVVEKESLSGEEITQLESESEELEALKQEALREEALQRAKEAEEALTGKISSEDDTRQDEEGTDDSEGDGEEQKTVEGDDAQSLQAQEVDYGNESATAFHAAVTDFPRIIGLTEDKVTLGEKIQVQDDNIFYTILGITRMVEKYGILPEIVYFDENMQITLVYQQGSVHCQLGKDSLLEEKITRVAAILPKLEGLTGILHLEDYTADTTNIIFSKESLYTLKSTIAEAGGTWTAPEEESIPEEESAQEEKSTPEEEAGDTGEAKTTPAVEGETGEAETTPTVEGETGEAETTPEVEGETGENGTTP